MTCIILGGGGGGGSGVLVSVFAGSWLFGTPTSLQFILWPIIDPLLITYANVNFATPT